MPTSPRKIVFEVTFTTFSVTSHRMIRILQENSRFRKTVVAAAAAKNKKIKNEIQPKDN